MFISSFDFKTFLYFPVVLFLSFETYLVAVSLCWGLLQLFGTSLPLKQLHRLFVTLLNPNQADV